MLHVLVLSGDWEILRLDTENIGVLRIAFRNKIKFEKEAGYNSGWQVTTKINGNLFQSLQL